MLKFLPTSQEIHKNTFNRMPNEEAAPIFCLRFCNLTLKLLFGKQHGMGMEMECHKLPYLEHFVPKYEAIFPFLIDEFSPIGHLKFV